MGYIAPNPVITEAKGLTIFPIKKSKRLWTRIFRLLKKVPAIRQFDPNFIHLHDPELLLVSPVLRFFGFKIIYDMHEDFYRELDDKPISWISNRSQKLVWNFIEKFILYDLPVVFAEESYAKHFDLATESVVVQNFPRRGSSLERHQPKRIPNGKPKFVYLGTISIDRGGLKMIEGLDNAFGASNYELHFIGDITDSELDVILQRVFAQRTDVIFHGYQSMQDAWKVCSECDVGLAILAPKTNYMESYPTKLFEYLICGLPIITSNFDLYRRLVEKYNVGLCIDPNSDDEISCACAEIVGKSRYSELSENITAFPFEKFVWEKEFEKFTDYLRKI